jgi:hypothetical protein
VADDLSDKRACLLYGAIAAGVWWFGWGSNDDGSAKQNVGNYSVSDESGDLDCVDIGREVYVGDDDPNGLDRDGDGYGCESYN